MVVSTVSGGGFIGALAHGRIHKAKRVAVDRDWQARVVSPKRASGTRIVSPRTIAWRDVFGRRRSGLGSQVIGVTERVSRWDGTTNVMGRT